MKLIEIRHFVVVLLRFAGWKRVSFVHQCTPVVQLLFRTRTIEREQIKRMFLQQYYTLLVYIQANDTVFAYNQINDVLALWFWLIKHANQINGIHELCNKIIILIHKLHC